MKPIDIQSYCGMCGSILIKKRIVRYDTNTGAQIYLFVCPREGFWNSLFGIIHSREWKIFKD